MIVRTVVLVLGTSIAMGIAATKPIIYVDLSTTKIDEAVKAIELNEVKRTTILKVSHKIVASVNQLPDKNEFLSEVNKIARELGVDPALLLIKFYIESKIDPTEKNKDSGASGIFQLMPENMPANMTPKEFRKLTATQQLKYYREYIKPYKRFLKKAKIEDLYLLNLYPAAVKKKSEVIFRYPDQKYIQNMGLDLNKDGKITRKDIRKRIESLLIENEG